jgi:hypothetical protein
MEARKTQPQAAAFHLSLRIRHPSIDPDDISRELQTEAEYCFKAGEPRGGGGALAAPSVHAESYWLAALDPVSWPAAGYTISEGGLDLALVRCTTHFLRRYAKFIHQLQADGGEVSFLVELSTNQLRGFTLTPACAGALHELGVTVDFEFTSR